MECKYLLHKIYVVRFIPGILPEWNVNQINRLKFRELSQPGILPEWNVNYLHRAYTVPRYQPGILPEWNVNPQEPVIHNLRNDPESYQNGM